MTHVKAFELRKQTKAELTQQLDDLKRELLALRVSKAKDGNSPKLVKIGILRKSIARVMTIMSQNQREQLRIFYKGKKYLPLDLRAKKTRAIRRRLTINEASKKTVKQVKKLTHFPQRK
ncbi:60S ribosomal protein L35 [Globomyces sp. JEL0801]|nr:60S ribosomal protein L35 [Globomyces sp. JEL0801]